MLSKSYTCLPAGTVGIVISLFLVLAGYVNVQAEDQIINPEPTSISVAPGKELTFSVRYDVSDGNNELTGIGIRIHYDSSILEFVETNNVFDEDHLAGAISCEDDTGNQDGDDDTDKLILVCWFDVGGKWPGEDLPLTLFDIKFKAKDVMPPVDTSINFTTSSTAAGYDFNSQPLEVKIRSGTGEPDITVTPTNLDFGNVMIGNARTKTVIIKNDGDVDLSITDISITGSNEFSQTNDCPSELSPDSSCTIDVEFSPASGGNKTATLKISSDDPDEGEVNVVLTGKGVLSGEGFQSITPNPTSINAGPGDEFQFSIKYDASSNALIGISFYIHYSSFFLDFIEVSDVFEQGYIMLPEDDIDDKDGYPITDKRFAVFWAEPDFSPSWPNSELPLKLMDITFHIKEWICPPLDTPINFTENYISQGCAFQSTSMKLHIVPFHLDIDGDGRVKPLTDGLLVIRHLFGLTGNNLVNGAIATGGFRTDSSKIAYWIDKGVGNLLLDIDDDGVVMPLTDGLLAIRYLFGFRDEDLVMGVVDPSGGRTGSNEIVEYIEKHLMPSS